MHKLGEPTALVKVRQADTMLVKEVMEAARKQYAGEQQTPMPSKLHIAACGICGNRQLWASVA
jgi:hypothetical protein